MNLFLTIMSTIPSKKPFLLLKLIDSISTDISLEIILVILLTIPVESIPLISKIAENSKSSTFIQLASRVLN